MLFAALFGLGAQEATDIVSTMAGKVSQWQDFFARQGVCAKDIETLVTAFRTSEQLGLTGSL